MWQAVPAALFAACVLAGLARDCRRGWLAGILSVNWLLCTAGVQLIGDPYPVEWFAPVDWLSALAALVASRMIWGRANLTEILVGILYGAEIVCHAMQFRAIDPVSMKYAGWFFLRNVALAQIIVFYALWSWDGLSRHFDLPRRSVSRLRSLRVRAPSSRE